MQGSIVTMLARYLASSLYTQTKFCVPHATRKITLPNIAILLNEFLPLKQRQLPEILATVSFIV